MYIFVHYEGICSDNYKYYRADVGNMTKYTVTDGTHTETYPNKDLFVNAMNEYGDKNALYYMGTDITVVAGKRFERIKHGGYNIGWYHYGGEYLIPSEWFDN